MTDTATLRAISAARIAELGRQYLARTQEELGCVDALLDRVERGDEAARAEIAQLAHRINGAGATLGFPALSAAASIVESIASGESHTNSARLAAAVRVLRQRLEGAT